jgi:hypothetical protein
MQQARAKRALLERQGLELSSNDPFAWVTRFTKSRDDQWASKGTTPYAHFPAKPHIKWALDLMRTQRRLLIAKSRDLMLSWCMVAYAVWEAEFRAPASILIQSQTQDKALELVSGRETPGYARTLWEQQDEFLRNAFPLTKPSSDFAGDLLAWKNGSIIKGVPSGESQIRTYHPRLFLVDEGAFLEGFAASWSAAESVASKIVAISSAAPSDFGQWVMSAP